MNNLPTFESYGNYESDNYGAHCSRFRVGDKSIWFSYNTVVAFHTPETGKVVSENCWGPTTGKHLNWIDDKDHKNRLPRDEFEKLMSKHL